MSFAKKYRRSGTPWRSMMSRSTPAPKANPAPVETTKGRTAPGHEVHEELHKDRTSLTSATNDLVNDDLVTIANRRSRFVVRSYS